mgnify:CR=1 FL=1
MTEILIFIIATGGTLLIPTGYTIYQETRYPFSGILMVVYGLFCLIVTLAAIISLF